MSQFSLFLLGQCCNNHLHVSGLSCFTKFVTYAMYSCNYILLFVELSVVQQLAYRFTDTLIL
jgi:hypothetical protein